MLSHTNGGVSPFAPLAALRALERAMGLKLHVRGVASASSLTDDDRAEELAELFEQTGNAVLGCVIRRRVHHLTGAATVWALVELDEPEGALAAVLRETQSKLPPPLAVEAYDERAARQKTAAHNARERVGTGLALNETDTTSEEWERRIVIRIRVHSVRAVTQAYDPRQPPDGVHPWLHGHEHLDDSHHSLTVQGLQPELLPEKIVVAFTSAAETATTAPLEDSLDRQGGAAEADGQYAPRKGQDLIVTKRWMRKLERTTLHHSWHAAESRLTIRSARRGGADLASCTFDLSEMVPSSGYAVIGPEDFNMGAHWRLQASIELIVPGEPEQSELGQWAVEGHHVVTVNGPDRVVEGQDEEDLYLDSEDEGDRWDGGAGTQHLHGREEDGEDSEDSLWGSDEDEVDDGGAEGGAVVDSDELDAQLKYMYPQPEPEPQPEPARRSRPRMRTALRTDGSAAGLSSFE